MLHIITKTQRVATATLMLVSVLSVGLPISVVAVTVENTDSINIETSTSLVQTCRLETSAHVVNEGGSITLSWSTTGFDTATINGAAVTVASGNLTITNITESETYTLRATSESGGSCTATVDVSCIKIDTPPVPVPKCELSLSKSASAATVTPGQEFTYTLTIENTGDADCTGGGVKIEDKLATNLQFLDATASSNITLGYGTKSVYTPADRIVRFNGHTLTPGERGIMTIRVKAPAPAVCGDVSIVNTGKTTAKELNNFQTWITSNTVTVVVDNDCVPVTPKLCVPGDEYYNPEADLRGTITLPGSGTVTNSSDYCDYTMGLASYEKFDEVIDNQIIFDRATGVVAANSTKTLTITVPTCAYQIDLFYGPVLESLKGQRYGDRLLAAKHVNGANYCGVPVKPQCPYTSADGVVVDFGDARIFSSRGAAQSQSTPIAANLPVGEYSVRLVAWDGYAGRQTVSQPNERYRAVVADAAGAIVKTNDTSDLTDNVVSALFDAQVNSTLSVNRLGTKVYAEHSVYPDTSSPNSLNPICAVFTPIEVEEPLPTCDAFTAAPAAILKGATTTLAWETTNATRVVINNGVGEVAGDGSTIVAPLLTTSYQLTAFGVGDTSVSCAVPVTVTEPPVETPFTCENNVTFSASPINITQGESSTLTWTTTNVDSILISGINATALSGSQAVSPTSDTTYVLTAKQGTKEVNCPVSVDVETGGGGGGGGGSSTPRCELTISDRTITRGDEITLRWDTSRATKVEITDDRGNVIVTTDDKLGDDKEDLYDGSITLTPTRNTEYTLVAARGSRDRECRAKVELEEDEIVVLEIRDQQPLVAGIALSAVPYTGFEAGPLMTIMFYALLVSWALYIAYVVVVRPQLVGQGEGTPLLAPEATRAMQMAEEIRPDVFVTVTPPTTKPLVSDVPANLPTGSVSIGYDAVTAEPVVADPHLHQATDAIVTALEDRAHAQKALLSSDAVRYFIATTEGSVERFAVLDQVISEAKNQYPLEDGWIVVNEVRMRGLCEECLVTATAAPTSFVPATVPEGSGSLAEAIVTGNVVAAYAMIGARPMFALADAAADFDAVVRLRKGAGASVSDMLKTETARLTDTQLTDIITALTGALDGTYTDEASAVKMAIMKAVKVAAS